ncbi:MAG: hypothetical protein ACHQU1_07980 [Gemmatimonadales bacterium]
MSKRKDTPTGTRRKSPYRKPVLRTHGDIREITKAKHGNRGDGGGKPKTKTTGAV